jgi:hypothetical protein
MMVSGACIRRAGRHRQSSMSAQGLGCVKTKSDLVVMPAEDEFSYSDFCWKAAAFVPPRSRSARTYRLTLRRRAAVFTSSPMIDRRSIISSNGI